MAIVAANADEAVTGIADGSTVLIGGFGPAGQPVELIDALIRSSARDLTVVNNNAGNGRVGLAALLANGQVRKIICSYPRQTDSYVFDKLYRAGKVELELVPQGNLAERLRAAGAGIGAFLCPTGVGTPLVDQGLFGPTPSESRLPQDGPQLRSGHGHRGEDHDRTGQRDR
jgi:3-oxoadipate CoA-transferase, alpha subunit